MESKTVGIIAILGLVIGLFGVIGTVILPQNLNVLILALLPISLFLENHKILMDSFYGDFFGKILKGIRLLILFALIVGFAFYFILAVIGGAVITPLFTALLCVGLFFANRSFNQLQICE
ncbi:MAG: hypothetical protein CVV32_07240 [Methanomicrobiales archaeon HGW-Methanomicrobiales-3]|jgi:hypothetical protein|nr:MAG: hypothetical protein CVV32_07240 [Methanomicrobiales archaeon HGW-Methanomicrobiales-3]